MTDQDIQDQDAWFSTGYDEMDSMPDEGSRFRMKADEERVVMFVDGSPDDKERFGTRVNAPFCINEFEFATERPDGELEYYNWLTSTKGRFDSSGEPIPDWPRRIIPAMKPYYAGFYTILDITDAWDKDRGDVFKNILVCKKKLLKILRRHARKREGLRGCVYTVSRSSKKVARTGDDWQFEEKLDDDEINRYLSMAKLKDAPFDYLRLLAPKSEEECRTILATYVAPTPFGSDNSRGGRGRGRDDDRDRGRSRRRDRDDDYDRDDDRRRSRRRSRDDRDDDYDRDRGRGRSRGRDRDDRDRDDRDRDDRDQDRGRSRSRDDDRDSSRRSRRQERDDRDDRGSSNGDRSDKDGDRGQPAGAVQGNSSQAPDDDIAF